MPLAPWALLPCLSLPALLDQPLFVLRVCSVTLCWVKPRNFTSTSVERAFGIAKVALVDGVVTLTAEAADNGRSAHGGSLFAGVLDELHGTTDAESDKDYGRDRSEHSECFCEECADTIEH